MPEEVTVPPETGGSYAPAKAPAGFWLDRIARAFTQAGVPFQMFVPGGI